MLACVGRKLALVTVNYYSLNDEYYETEIIEYSTDGSHGYGFFS